MITLAQNDSSRLSARTVYGVSSVLTASALCLVIVSAVAGWLPPVWHSALSALTPQWRPRYPALAFSATGRQAKASNQPVVIMSDGQGHTGNQVGARHVIRDYRTTEERPGLSKSKAIDSRALQNRLLVPSNRTVIQL